MSLDFKEKTETSAVSLLMKPDNVVKESKIRSLAKKAAKMVRWSAEHPLESLFWTAGPALVPWIGPVGSILLGAFWGIAGIISLEGEEYPVRARRGWGAMGYFGLLLFSFGTAIYMKESPPPVPEKGVVLQRGYDDLRAQYAAGKQDLASHQERSRKKMMGFSWGYENKVLEAYELQAKAADARPIDGQVVCRASDAGSRAFTMDADLCPILVEEDGKTLEITIKNRKTNESFPGVTVATDGKAFVLPLTVSPKPQG